MSKSVCIFCGSSSGNSQHILNQSLLLCDLLIQNDFNLVYGGSNRGLMGMIADRFLEAGKKVIGIQPKKLITDESLHHGLTETIIVEDMHDRKKLMIEKADVFIALPGGVGTLDEIVEVYTYTKIGFVNKICAVLNTNNYYQGLDNLLMRMVGNGFLKGADKRILHIVQDPEILMAIIMGRKEIDKLAYIEIQDGKILTTLSKGKDKYYIPGGKRDEGESDIEALARECMEEMTIQLDTSTCEYIGTFRAQAHGKKAGTIVKMSCYSSKYSGEIKPDNEIAEIKWLNYKDKDLVSFVDVIIFDYLKEKGLLK